MIKFIVCDDNKSVRDINKDIIFKVLMNNDFDYQIKTFEKYNNELKKIINDENDIKIYILDLEMEEKSGIDIAKEIRKKDWDSIIIILTSHDELELKVLKQKLLIYDFISKFDDYKTQLTNSINTILSKIGNKKIITFKHNGEINHIKFENILFVYKLPSDDKISIVTDNKEYIIRMALTSIIKKLDSRFIQTHRACYVNKNLVKKVDLKEKIIYFDNNIQTNLLSRNYKNNLKGV